MQLALNFGHQMLRWSLVLTPLLAACTGAADIPDTPDLRKLAAQYEHPTATLDQTTVVSTLGQMPKLSELVAAFRAAGYTTDAVNTSSEDATTGSTRNLRFQGGIHVTIRCPGELADPSYDANGSISLTLGVEENLIKRGIGGTADHCVLRGVQLGQPIRVEIDGPFSLDLGRDIGLRQRWSGRLLMYMSGTISTPNLTLTRLSARWDEDKLEYLYEGTDGRTVVAVVTAEGKISIEDSGGEWGCTDNQTCVRN
jgi:hypothetical protein